MLYPLSYGGSSAVADPGRAVTRLAGPVGGAAGRPIGEHPEAAKRL
jgi:hypothetical protein